jgi:hypothetical protein
MRRDVQMAVGIGIALLFSLFYVGLFPMLTGGSMIYWYPYWPASLAIAYICGGILLQAGFCCFRGPSAGVGRLVAQTLAGVGYFALTLFASGGPYMS